MRVWLLVSLFLGCTDEGSSPEDAGVRREAGVGRPDSSLVLDGGEAMDASEPDATSGDAALDAEPGDTANADAEDASQVDTGDAGGPMRIVISEVTYDFASVTTNDDLGNEIIEVAGTGGASLAGLALEILDGAGAIIGTLTLAGTFPLDGLWVIANERAGGGTNVSNADQIESFDLPSTGGLRLVDATATLDGFGWGYAVEGAPVPAIVASAFPASWARSNDLLDSNDNLTDFRHDPTPTPGQPNGVDAFGVSSIDPDDAIALVDAAIRVGGTDFTDAMIIEVDGVALACTAESATSLDCALPYPSGGGGLAERVDVVARARPEHGGQVTLQGAFTWTTASNETGVSAECDYCVLQFPLTTMTTAGAATELIFGQIYEAGLTDTTAGRAPNVLAELGFGPSGSDPRASNAWTWRTAMFNLEVGNNDEYMNTLTVTAPGTYRYTLRFSLDGGLTWSYVDSDGAGSNAALDFDPMNVGVLTAN